MEIPSAFIAIEGIDGAGTTTLMANLKALLCADGHTVHTTSEPSRGEAGQLIRRLLSPDCEIEADSATLALLFAADRKLHWLAEIEPRLQKGEVVITDRYTLSSLAYQSIGEDGEWVASLNSKVPSPHLLIYVDIDPAVGMARITARGKTLERLEKLELQHTVRQNYLALYAAYDGPKISLSGTLSPAELAQAAYDACLTLFS